MTIEKGRKRIKIFAEMPKGWKELKGASTQPVGTIWISNGRSLFDKEYEQGLLIVDRELFVERIKLRKYSYV